MKKLSYLSKVILGSVFLVIYFFIGSTKIINSADCATWFCGIKGVDSNNNQTCGPAGYQESGMSCSYGCDSSHCVVSSSKNCSCTSSTPAPGSTPAPPSGCPYSPPTIDSITKTSSSITISWHANSGATTAYVFLGTDQTQVNNANGTSKNAAVLVRLTTWPTTGYDATNRTIVRNSTFNGLASNTT